MPELRYNSITRDWVIISTERAKRPDQFGHQAEAEEIIPEHDAHCPFCTGNESFSERERFQITDGDRWLVRVVANKFPALDEFATNHRKHAGIYNSMQAFGIHDVIIENPRHNATLTDITHAEMVLVFQAYLRRYKEMKADPRIESILIFRNHGKAAGTSLIHPHSQIVGTPVVPHQIRDRMDTAMQFFDAVGECIFCRTLHEEITDGKRIVFESKHFAAFIPYAALSPFHIWIFPKRHEPSFDSITADEIADLATNLQTVLLKLRIGLHNPSYNITIRPIPTHDQNPDYYHWYVAIVPRINVAAGFELGSGMYISPAIPEESAKYLREITVRPIVV
jgi:UDPglucose--hexose-1-phosphate uridylyltransferase